MFKKITSALFIIGFFSLILVRLISTDFLGGKVSQDEQRKLAAMPSIVDKDGINREFTSQFESWICDNLGGRNDAVVLDERVLYKYFHSTPSRSNYKLGPGEVYNYATASIIKSYQHLDLKSEDSLKTIAKAYQYVYDYVKPQGTQMYYFQCWDKQSIYPEYFPDTIIQHGDISKTDQIVDTLTKRTDICVVSPKQALIDYKSEYPTYSKWGDPTHWTQRGAYIGYLELINAINANNNNKYKVLGEEDYDITVEDDGRVLYSTVKKVDMLEHFNIKEPKAKLSDEEPKWLSTWAKNSRRIYYNDEVDNDDTLLIMGDSYFDGFLYDDLAESFHKVVQVWGTYSNNIKPVIDEYKPNIIIIENAERADRTSNMVKGAKKLKKALKDDSISFEDNVDDSDEKENIYN